MYNQNNKYYSKKIPKYETRIYNRHYNSITNSNIINSNHINYNISSEDEKTNSKSNYYLSEKNKTINNKYKPNSKFNVNSYPITNSLKFYNENNNKIELKNNNKIIIPDNYSRSPKNTFASFNYIINGKNLNNQIYINNGNSLINGSSRKNSNRKPQNFMTPNNHLNLNYCENSHLEGKIKTINNNNLYNHNKQTDNKYTYNLCERLNENNAILDKSFKAAQFNTITEENENKYNSKTNLARRKNLQSLTEINNNKKLNIIYNNNLYDKNKKETKENTYQDNANTNKKNIITKIPNYNNKIKNNKFQKTNNNNNNININTHKKIGFSKIKKLSFINISNLSNLNESNQNNITDKHNHSFYEVKSLSRDFTHHQTECLITEPKKMPNKIRNLGSVLTLSSKKNSESNLNKCSINNSINNENIYKTKNNFFKKQIDNSNINLTQLISESKRGNMAKEYKNKNKKSNSEIISNIKINNLSNNNLISNKPNDIKKIGKIINNKEKTKIGNMQIKNGEKKNLIKKWSDFKIREISNRRDNINIGNFLRKNKYKYKVNRINTYFFNYLPKAEKKKNKKNKKFVINKKLLTLMNIKYKSFEEDFPLKIRCYKRYKLNKNLKPQISVRITLFNVLKPERERYFVVNYFYSENIRNPIITENDFF